MTTSLRPLTLTAFLEQSEIEASPAWEYMDGAAHQKPMPQIHHSRLQLKLSAAIELAAGQNAAVFPELRCTVGNRSVVPDIFVLTAPNIPLTASGELENGAIAFAPDWVIEIISPAQTSTRVIDNILHCLAHGSVLGWLLDPEERAVVIFQPKQEPKIFRADQPLIVLPNIELPLTANQIFGWLTLQGYS
ncbi:MAG: Uma2 family endonuclease [Thermosynechococcaceae cyanobacterium]